MYPGLFCCLDDDRAACGKRRRNLPGGRRGRKIPRRKRGRRANRLRHNKLPNIRGSSGNNAAIGSSAFVGRPFNNIHCGVDFAAGFRENLPLFEGERQRNVITAAAQDLCSLAQHTRTIVGRDFSPHSKCALCCRERPVEILRRRVPQIRDRPLGCRIDNGFRHAAFSAKPYAVDIKSEIRIHNGLSAAPVRLHSNFATWRRGGQIRPPSHRS